MSGGQRGEQRSLTAPWPPCWRSWTVAALGLPPVAAAFRRATRTRLRVVAYHGIPDAGAFARQLDAVIARYTPVSGGEVAAALAAGSPLPANAVWITFDDGNADVIERGLPLLLARRLPATLFVCPGLAAGTRRAWWDDVEDAVRAGWSAAGRTVGEAVGGMKRMADGDRRALVEGARRWAAAAGVPARPTIASEPQLREWLAAGLEVGNHTWDHACLDRIPAEEQRAQILEADRWLHGLGAFAGARLFAYPGGAWTQAAERVLVELGYGAALLFDHRLARVPGDGALRLSRLCLDSDAPVPRARAVVSGAHAALFHRLRRGGRPQGEGR